MHKDEIIKQLISLRHHCNSMNDEIFKKRCRIFRLYIKIL